jgi:hypothetical protein
MLPALELRDGCLRGGLAGEEAQDRRIDVFVARDGSRAYTWSLRWSREWCAERGPLSMVASVAAQVRR